MHQTTPPQTPAVSREPENGSAFVITLLSMVVLGIILLSLSVITGIERQIATNEVQANRIFYASDTGLNLATVRALIDGETSGSNIIGLPQPATYFLPEPPIASTNRSTQLEITPFFPISKYPCNLCQSSLGTMRFWNVNHAVTSTATRLTWTGGGATPPADASVHATKQTYFQVAFQPWPEPTSDALSSLSDDYSSISQDTKGVHAP